MLLLDWGLRNTPSAGGPSFCSDCLWEVYLGKLIRRESTSLLLPVMQGPAEGPGDGRLGWMTDHSCGDCKLPMRLWQHWYKDRMFVFELLLRQKCYSTAAWVRLGTWGIEPISERMLSSKARRNSSEFQGELAVSCDKVHLQVSSELG